MIKNKKGDIPGILLFFVAIILATLALFAFISFNNDFTGDAKQLSDLVSNAQFSQDYIKENIKFLNKETLSCTNQNLEQCKISDIKERFKSFASKGTILNRDIKIAQERLQKGEFTLEKNQDNTYTFKFNDLKIKNQEGGNILERNLNLCMQFSSEGDYLQNCPEETSA